MIRKSNSLAALRIAEGGSSLVRIRSLLVGLLLIGHSGANQESTAPPKGRSVRATGG